MTQMERTERNELKSSIPLLARRFLFSPYTDGFLSFIAWVAIIGVALGVAALTVVTSTINGFEGELARVITSTNGDVVLYSRGDPIRNPKKLEQDIRSIVPGIEAVTHTFSLELMAAGAAGVPGAILQGVDRETLSKVTEIEKRLSEGRMPAKGSEVALGRSLADKIGVKVGDPVRLVVPFGDQSSSTPKVLNAVVSGILHLGMHDYDSKFVLMPIQSVQGFLKRKNQVTNFNIKLKDRSQAATVAEQLNSYYSYPLRAKDWGQFNRNIFYAIQLEKAVIAIILTVIVIVAAFNVVSTLMMMIHDKTKEVSILKAMGFLPSQSFRLFCLIGVGIGLIGTFLGASVGIGLGLILEKTRLIQLPADVYTIGYLPVNLRWLEIAVICVVAVLIAFFATLYPSWKVAKRPPLEGLRYEE